MIDPEIQLKIDKIQEQRAILLNKQCRNEEFDQFLLLKLDNELDELLNEI